IYLRHTDVVKSVDRASTLSAAHRGGDARGASGAGDASAVTRVAADAIAAVGDASDSRDVRVPADGSGASDVRAVPVSGTAGAVTSLGSERGTRARIARLILENGPVTAAALSTRLGLTPAAVRRHLDNLLAGGLIEARTARRMASRGRGRPAKLFAITDAGRSAFEHAYDDLATGALPFLAEVAGPRAGAEVAPPAGRRAREPVPAGDGVRRCGQGQGARRGPVGGRLRRLGHQRPQPGRRRRRATLPAPLPGGACRRRVPATVRGGDRSVRQAARDPGAAPGHDRAWRRDLHHARDRARARPHPHDDTNNQ